MKRLIVDGFTDSDLLALLTESIGEAEKCAGVARQLASQKMKTRARQSGGEELTLLRGADVIVF